MRFYKEEVEQARTGTSMYVIFHCLSAALGHTVDLNVEKLCFKCLYNYYLFICDGIKGLIGLTFRGSTCSRLSDFWWLQLG